jgi:hypothetical protein
MTFLCRTLGHKPARNTVQRDPATLALHAQCKRCGVALAHKQHRWEEQAVAGASTLESHTTN